MRFILRIFPEIVLPLFLKKFNSIKLSSIWFVFIFMILLSMPFQTAYSVGTTFQSTINLSNNGGDSTEPKISKSGSNIHVIWEDDTSGIDDILFSNSNDDGMNFNALISLSSNTSVSQDSQFGTSGNIVGVLWRDNQSGNEDILFKTSSDNGLTFGSTLNISNDNDNSIEPKISLSGNNVYTVWRNDTVSNEEVLFSRSINGGTSFSSTLNLSNNAGDSRNPQISAVSNNVYVTWRDLTSDSSGDILFRASTDNGANFASSTNLSSTNGNESREPELASTGNSVYAVWKDNNPGNNDIFFRASTNNGASFGSTINLSSNSGNSVLPEISSSGTNVGIVWRDDTLGNAEILFVASDNNGSSFSSQKNISNSSGTSTLPKILLSGSTVYVVWDDNTGDPQGDGDVSFKKGTLTNTSLVFNSTQYRISETAEISVTDSASNTNNSQIETITALVISSSDSTGISLILTETTVSSGTFTGTFTFSTQNTSGNILKVKQGDTVTGSYNGEIGSSSIFPRNVAFQFSGYNMGSEAVVIVTDENSNLDSGIAENIFVKITSTTDQKGFNLQLSETGLDTGQFQNDVLIFLDGNDFFPINKKITVNIDDSDANSNSAAFETVNVSIKSTSDTSGITLILNETSTNSGIFANKDLKFIPGTSTGSSLQASNGDIITASYTSMSGGADSKAIISPNPNPKVGAIRSAVGDTITATYLGVSGTASIGAGPSPGGGGGGIVRAGLVVDFIVGIGGSATHSAPLVSLGTLASNTNFEMPDEVRKIVENYNPSIPLAPMNPDSYPNFDFPFTIRYNPYSGYPLVGYENFIETNVIEVGTPVTLTFTLYEQSEIQHFSLHTNLNGIQTQIHQSDTQIIYNKNKPLEIVDPHGFFKEVNLSIKEIEDTIKKQVVIEFIPNKPMNISDIITRTWDQDLYSRDLIIRDAIEFVEPNKVEIFKENIPEPVVEQLKANFVPIWVKNNAGWWAEELIDDENFVAGLEYLIQNNLIKSPEEKPNLDSSAEIPDWIRNNAGWWSKDLISEKEFIDSIQWLTSKGILRLE